MRRAAAVVGDRLWVAPSCSLLHAPVTLANEPKLDDELKGWLAFADEKLVEELHELRESEAVSRRNSSRQPSTRVSNSNKDSLRREALNAVATAPAACLEAIIEATGPAPVVAALAQPAAASLRQRRAPAASPDVHETPA